MTSEIGRPARGYSVSPPGHLTRYTIKTVLQIHQINQSTQELKTAVASTVSCASYY